MVRARLAALREANSLRLARPMTPSAGSSPRAGRCFRFERAHRLRPVCRRRCNAMRCISQAQAEGPLQLKHSSQLNTATHIELNIGAVSAFWAVRGRGLRRPAARRARPMAESAGHSPCAANVGRLLAESAVRMRARLGLLASRGESAQAHMHVDRCRVRTCTSIMHIDMDQGLSLMCVYTQIMVSCAHAHRS